MTSPLTVLLDLLFPPRCPFCGKLFKGHEVGLCAQCQKDLPWLEGHAGEQKGEFFSLCVSPLRYEGMVRESIHRYKFDGNRGYAELYGSLVAQCVRDHLAGEYDLISWVPLSPKRKRERGYDQAGLLAQAAARQLGMAATDLLRKTRHTTAQSGLEGAAQRRANVMGAYETIAPQLVAGKRVLLIDDVVTSGATFTECASTLRLAGAVDIKCATLARAR